MIAFLLKNPPVGFPAVVVVDTTDLARAQAIIRQSLPGSGEIDVYPLGMKGYSSGTRVMCSEAVRTARPPFAPPSNPAPQKTDTVPSTYVDDGNSGDPDFIGTPIRDPDFR